MESPRHESVWQSVYRGRGFCEHSWLVVERAGGDREETHRKSRVYFSREHANGRRSSYEISDSSDCCRARCVVVGGSQEPGWRSREAAKGDFHSGSAKTGRQVADSCFTQYRQHTRSADAYWSMKTITHTVSRVLERDLSPGHLQYKMRCSINFEVEQSARTNLHSREREADLGVRNRTWP